MTQIKVTSVETKQSKDEKTTFYQVWDNVLSYSTFDSKILELRPGDIIEATVELVKGKYKNITAYKVLPRTEQASTAQPQQEPKVPPKTAQSYPTKDFTAERISIEGQVALKEVGAAMIAKLAVPQDIIDRYYQAIRIKLATFIGETPTTDTTKGVKKSPDASSKATPYPDTKEGRQKLVSDYVRKGMPLTGENGVYDLLGIKTPAEIIDIDEAVKVLEAHRPK